MADAALKAPVLGGAAGKTVGLDGAAFSAGFHMPLVHQSVRAEQAARRRGTAATKTRAMVSGGSAKPWRQKGTGRARAGSSRSPIWTGGGTVFGPQPRSYTFKVNRKEQRAALRSALSLHASRGSLAVVDASVFTAPKTSQAMDLLDDWNQPRPPPSSRSRPRSPTRRCRSATWRVWRCWRTRMWASPTSWAPPRWCFRRLRSTRSPRAPAAVPARRARRREGAGIQRRRESHSCQGPRRMRPSRLPRPRRTAPRG